MEWIYVLSWAQDCDQKRQNVAKDRSTWRYYSNLQKMYDLVFNARESAGVALKLDEPSWMNEKGEALKDESKAFGLKCTHKLIHPE